MSVRLRRVILRLIALLVITTLGFVAFESTARVIWRAKYNAWLSLQLNGWDRLDAARSVIIPVPNTEVTVHRYRELLAQHGKQISLAAFNEHRPPAEEDDTTVLFRLNEHGFKGPPLSASKDGLYRILCIGNSVTWGPPEDSNSYPRVLESELNAAGDTLRYEVVNAGVPGYNYERVLKRLDEFLWVKPEMVTIMLGWNRTILRADPRKHEWLYRELALYRIWYHFVVNRHDTGLDEAAMRAAYYDKMASDTKSYNDYSFGYDIGDLEVLINRVRSTSPTTRVVLITLAGLYDWRLDPDKVAISKGYPIASSRNLYAWTVLTRRYNSALRLTAKRLNVELIDWENGAMRMLVPRSDYFVDSVHLNRVGHQILGHYLAVALGPVIKRHQEEGIGSDQARARSTRPVNIGFQRSVNN